MPILNILLGYRFGKPWYFFLRINSFFACTLTTHTHTHTRPHIILFKYHMLNLERLWVYPTRQWGLFLPLSNVNCWYTRRNAWDVSVFRYSKFRKILYIYINIYIHTHTYTHTHIYIYIYNVCVCITRIIVY